MGMSKDDMMKMFDQLMEETVDKIADEVAYWDGDSEDDILARAVLGNLRPMIEAMRETKDGTASSDVVSIFIKQFLATVENMRMLKIASMRRRGEIDEN